MMPVPAEQEAEQEIVEMERQWAEALQRRDAAAMEQFLADTYFLAVAVEGEKMRVFPRETWLETLKVYKIDALSIDDFDVHVYGDTAVVKMVWNQRATVGDQDRSAVFFITDIWVRRPEGWRVVERHSSRPEPKATMLRQ